MGNLPFDPVVIEFEGKEYTVESDRVWGLLKSISSVIGMTKLTTRLINQDPDEFLFADAYAAALNYAGRKGTTGAEVMASSTGIDYFVEIGMWLFTTLQMAMPKKQLASEDDLDDHEKKD